MSGDFYKKLAVQVRGQSSARMMTLLPQDGECLPGSHALVAANGTVEGEPALAPFWQSALAAMPAQLPAVFQAEGRRVLAEELTLRPKLVICGGGHISAPLAAMGAMLDFEVTVIDDREEFANAQRFPTASQVMCMPFEQALARVEGGPSAYYVIITRGHSADRQCLELILERPNAYIGMIGSKHKVAVVMEQMERDGYPKALLERVHAPIGLKIGAQTPAEIALCIAAEMVQTRRRGAAEGCLEDAMLELLEQGERPMVMATIVEKSGSAPRSTGARMLVLPDGSICGSVGGGAAEAQVIRAAVQVLAHGNPMLVECNMTNDDAKKQGMVCGGKIAVFLERI